jgi:hypothetical protein
MQEHQPWRAGLAGAGRQCCRTRSLERQKAASRDIGDPFDHAGSGPIDQQHLTDHAGGSARYQRRKGRDGGLFDAFGGNNDAQHGRFFDA